MKLTKMEQLKEGMRVKSSNFNEHGDLKEGKLHKEKYSWYVCSNEHDGSNCENKLGYKYSWVFDSESELSQLNLETIEPKQLRDCVAGDIIIHKECGFKRKIMFANEFMVIVSSQDDYTKIDNSGFGYTWEELGKKWKPCIEPEPEPIKMTVAECAAKMGINPKQLHIIDK